MGLSTLIGIGAGLVAAAAIYPSQKRNPGIIDLSELIFPAGIFYGAFYGAIVGGIVSLFTPVKTFFIDGGQKKWNLFMEYVKEPDNPKFRDRRDF